MHDELNTQDMREAVTKVLGKHKTTIIFVGLLTYGVAFTLDHWIGSDITITAYRISGFLLFVGGLISSKKELEGPFATPLLRSIKIEQNQKKEPPTSILPGLPGLPGIRIKK